MAGQLTETAPRATFDLQLEAGEVVTLTADSSEGLDTVLVLTGPAGRRVAENDDEAPGILSSRIVYVAPASGTYTAVVTGYGGATGGFELTVTSGLSVGLSDSARTLREEAVSFSAATTESRYTVNLAAGEILVASTFALTPELDPTLALLDANGAILAQSDDRGDGSLNSQIVYQAVEAGRYEIVASTYGASGVGDMLLSLAVDPEAEPPFNFAALEGEPIARHQGAIDSEQPSHDYRVDLAAGQTLLAVADATSGDLDPVLRLSDAQSNPVALNDDRGDGSLNSALTYISPVAATYTLTLERYRRSDSSGEFTLVLSSVDASVAETIQALLEAGVVLSGPELSIETPDFHVYYTLEGEDASTPEYAQSVGDTLQAMLEAQVTRLGWAEPVRDDDGRYRAYVADANGNLGYTKMVRIVFDNPNTANVRESTAARTVFVIENDFAGIEKEAPPESLMRATVTHEFNHVVQYGYDAEEGLGWLYESSATWIETATVGADQDATDYTETDFAAPQLCWTTNTDGHDYSQWTLLQSLADQYGEGIVVRLWENAVPLDGFEVMDRTMASVGTTTPDALQRWRAQNYARAYALAPHFPRAVQLHDTIHAAGTFTSKSGVEQLGAHYIALALQGRHSYAIDGDANLELVALGRRNGQIHVVRLGRSGVFDSAAYDNAALMVFNRALPPEPGECSAVRYSINVTGSTRTAAPVSYRFSAEHFAPLTE